MVVLGAGGVLMSEVPLEHLQGLENDDVLPMLRAGGLYRHARVFEGVIFENP